MATWKSNQDVLMKEEKSKDNCCLWIPKESSYSSTCFMTKEERKGYEEWQLGKQTKVSQPKLRHHITSKVLELPPDPIGCTQVKNVGGRRNIDVVVNEYSRLTWGEFFER